MKSKKDNKLYTGATSDLRERFKEHDQGKVFSTKSRGPFDLIYYEACLDKGDAFAREKYLKSGLGKRYLKKRLNRSLSQTGFSTLEILIAFSLIILSITALILVVFGNQTISVDTQTNHEALYKARQGLEEARALSRQSFSSVVTATSTWTPLGGLTYFASTTIADLTQCKKQATSTIAWNLNSPRPQKIELTTFLSDIAGAIALGGDCDADPPSGDWSNPIIHATPILGNATDIDVKNQIIYATASSTTPSESGLLIYTYDPATKSITPKGTTGIGANFNAIDIAGHYAYIANASTTDQLEIFDVADVNNPTLAAKATLPNLTKGLGRSIFYYDKKVYEGTQALGCPSCSPSQNNEFHIFDVSDPIHPVWIGSKNINNNVNAIVVREKYAYLATSGDDRELIILDISNPTNIIQVGTFNAVGTASASEDATSLYLLGNNLYLGRERTPSSRPDFYVLDIRNSANPISLTTVNLGLKSGTEVTGIRVAGQLAFISTSDATDGLQIRDISTTALSRINPKFTQSVSGLDFENNTAYLLTTSGSNNLTITESKL